MFIPGIFDTVQSTLGAVDFALKSIVFLSLISIVVMLLRSFAATLRHRVISYAMFALLILPALGVLAPGWHLPTVSIELPLVYSGVSEDSALSRESESALLQQNEEVSQPINWYAQFNLFVPVFWLSGFLLQGSRFVRDWLRTKQIYTQAVEVREPTLVSLIAEIRRELGLQRCPRVLHSSELDVPVLCRVSAPAVVLPTKALTWRRERLRSVLMHEFAHIQRGDLFFHFISQVACAFNWFNPLAWMLYHRLADEREKATDDHVVAAGIQASVYAGHLLETYKDLNSQRHVELAGIGVAHTRRGFKDRMMTLLKSEKHHRSVSRWQTYAAAALLAALALVTAGFSLWTSTEKQIVEESGELPSSNSPSAATTGLSSWQNASEDEETINSIIARLHNEEPAVREKAVAELVPYGEHRLAQNGILRASKDSTARVRAKAYWAMGEVLARSFIPTLRSAPQAEQDPGARTAAQAAAEKMRTYHQQRLERQNQMKEQRNRSL